MYDSKKNPRSHLFLPGFYTLENLSSHPNKATYRFNGYLYNTTGNKILLDEDLADFLGYDTELKLKSLKKRLNSPTIYFVHCDLFDKRQNLLNGKPSTVLARFDICGQPFERFTTKQHNIMFCVIHRPAIMM